MLIRFCPMSLFHPVFFLPLRLFMFYHDRLIDHLMCIWILLYSLSKLANIAQNQNNIRPLVNLIEDSCNSSWKCSDASQGAANLMHGHVIVQFDNSHRCSFCERISLNVANTHPIGSTVSVWRRWPWHSQDAVPQQVSLLVPHSKRGHVRGWRRVEREAG